MKVPLSTASLAAEELLDLLFYRPAAFVLVRGISRLPITPNQVTMMSLAAGLAAAAAFAAGSRAGMIWGALLYLFANVLDCADGQLARLQQSGTLLGRVVDGAADYLSGIAIFAGLGIGLAASGTSLWWLVIFAGTSSALHAMLFDRYQSEFLAAAAGEPDFAGREIDRFSAEIDRLRGEGRGAMKVRLLQLYCSYLRLQLRFRPEKSARARRPASPPMIRLWSFLGPTTDRTLLIVWALCGRTDLYLWSVAVVLNAWMLFAWVFQWRVAARTAAVGPQGR